MCVVQLVIECILMNCVVLGETGDPSYNPGTKGPNGAKGWPGPPGQYLTLNIKH